MISNTRTRSFRTPAVLRHLLLIGAAFGVAGTLWAADAPPKSKEQQEIEQLQLQLQAVQAQMLELAEQNKELLQKMQRLTPPHRAAAAARSSPGADCRRGHVAGDPRPTHPPHRPRHQAHPLPHLMHSASPTSASTASPSASTTAPGASPPAAPGATLGPPASAYGGPSALANFKLWGYGELYYTDPTHDRAKAQADLARAVFGIGYVFDDKTEFNSEYEVEHAVSSASDVGEFEVEQFYVDRQINDAVAVRAGLFLMPFVC